MPTRAAGRTQAVPSARRRLAAFLVVAALQTRAVCQVQCESNHQAAAPVRSHQSQRRAVQAMDAGRQPLLRASHLANERCRTGPSAREAAALVAPADEEGKGVVSLAAGRLRALYG